MATTSPQPKSNSGPCSAVELSIAQERLRQAHHSFNLALVMTAACALISLIGIIFLFLGKGPEGTITAIAGLTSTIRCLELAKDTNDRLDKVALEIRSEA